MIGSFTIGAEHPALPGHFPGNPVVPGVVLLDHALALLPDRPAALPWVRFTGMVRPGDPCTVAIVRGRRGRTLEVRCGETVVMSAGLP